ncbi:MAG: hypothetical protein R3C10_04635 [Pirellulales bacterium]
MIPLPAIFPVLIFVGLEITAQSFHATPNRHYPAVALACVPAMAYLVMLFVDPLLAVTGIDVAGLPESLAWDNSKRCGVLSSGFIVTSLLWASALVAVLAASRGGQRRDGTGRSVQPAGFDSFTSAWWLVGEPLVFAAGS